MTIIHFLFRLVGIVLVFLLIFINTQRGKDFIMERGIPLQNNTIRILTGLDLDPELQPDEQLNDQRPIYGVFDLPAIFFMTFLLLSYILLSLDPNELRFALKQLFITTSRSKQALENLLDKLKELSESYYNSGTEAIQGVTGNIPIPPEMKLVLEQIEMRIPFDDILQILGNSAALTRKNYDRNIKIIANLSNLAPSFGVMGTVLGLMNVLGNLSDPTTLGPSMALALLTTFYGLFLSVIIFKPFLTHLENMKSIEMNSYQTASFWLKNLSDNKPSFYLDQTIQKTKVF